MTFIMVFSGLLVIVFLIFILKENKIDQDIDCDRNKYNRFYGRYSNKK